MRSFSHPPARVAVLSAPRAITRGQLSLLLVSVLATAVSAQQPDEPFAFDRATRWYDLASPQVSTGYGQTQGIALSDIDNDGTRDVVRMSLNRVEFLRGAGSGFHPPTIYLPTTFGYIGEAMRVADVTGDGLDDLVIAGTQQASPNPLVIQVLTGDGIGGFTPGAVTPLPWGQAFFVQMRTGDLDGDGIADVVLSNQWNDEVLVRLSTGQEQTLTVTAGAALRTFEIGDVDNDGLQDLVLLVDDPTTGDGWIDVRRNQGAGAYPVTGQTWSDGLVTGASHGVLALADFDGNGSLDVAVPITVVSPKRANLALLQNDGFGGFAAPLIQPLFLHWHIFADLDAVDLDDDGDADLVFSAHYSDGHEFGIVSTVLNDGGGGFTVRSTCAVIADEVEFDVNAATGERRLIDANLHAFHVARDGSIAPVRSVPPSAPVTRSAVLDFDGDGRDDIAVFDMEAGLVSIHLSNGARGTWSTVSFLTASLPLVLTFEAAEVDGDGWPDLVLHCQDRVVTLRNIGGQTLQQVETDLSTNPALCSRQYQGAGLGDIDGDGRADFVRVARYTTDAVVGFGTASGDFATECLQLPNWMQQVAIGDVTGDGLADLVMVPRGAGPLYVFAGTGQTPPFAAPSQQSFSVPVREDVVLGDLDRDGDLDVVAVGGPRFVVGLNNGAGGLVENQQFTMARGNFDQLRLADMNCDGQLDLLARGVWLGTHTLVLRNDGGVLRDDHVRWDWSASGSVGATAVAFSHHSACEHNVGDFDADGAPDLVVGGVFQDLTIDHTQVLYNRSQLRGFGYAKAGEAMTIELRQPAAPHALYVLLIGQSGSWPGIQLTPTVHLPLNAPLPLLDFYLAGGAGVFIDFIGLLDGSGRGDARLAIPPGFVPGAPIDLDMAMVTVDLATFELRTSNSMTVRVE